jgi:hypothetical protein
MIRKSILILALGLFMSATAANACDGPKAMKAGKGKKASATCTKGACAKHTKAMAAKSGSCSAKAMASGKHGCCKAKTTATAQKS